MGMLDDVVAVVRSNREWLTTRASVLRPTLRVVSLEPEGRARGSALISWVTEAFDLTDGELPTSHTHFWECRELARILLEMGFRVDVVNFRNILFRPRRSYDLFIDTRVNMERLGAQLGDDCLKIMHLERSHILFQNAAEFRRLVELKQRRQVALKPRRVDRRVSASLEHADCGVVYGNERTAATYAYAGKPLYRIPGTPVRMFDPPHDKDLNRVRSNFLWMGSNGLVLRGLDRVLEAFASMPNLHLTVCGPVDRESDFAGAFHRELYETPNITTLGWIDPRSERFEQLARSTIGLVYPSASEGQSGAVVTALHAGLLPIVTPEAGVDVDGRFGWLLEEGSVDELRTAAGSVANLPASDLAPMPMAAWRFARSTHTRQRFTSAYRSVLRTLLDGPP